MSDVVVVDLGFGDAGKGTTIDVLARRALARDGRAPLVVRFSGGAQAGHNVVTSDGRHHTFAQLGAGSFVGARTHHAPAMIVHPSGLLVEAAHLANEGVHDPLGGLTIDARCRLTTPFHQAAGRLRELAREAPHGTCGVGVGETVRDALAHPDDVVRAADLRDERALADKLSRVRERLRASLPPLDPHDARVAAELAFFEVSEVTARWIEAIRPLPRASVVDDFIPEGTVLLEGAQGVLLDEDVGFHPHTTWSRCGFVEAENWLASVGRHAKRLGVLRAYATRHGAGPFPSATTLARDEPHNDALGWQGAFRVGDFDEVLARYALRAAGGVDGLVLTHLDRPSPRRVSRYEGFEPEVLPADEFDARAAQTEALATVCVVREDAWSTPEAMAEALGVKLAITSYGPRAEDKRFVDAKI
ncbi:MAG: adenylosuccinate synthetase [Sandaracinus sp.]|nr:adenylosuccinate synthetase [Sandaracinus sp.]